VGTHTEDWQAQTLRSLEQMNSLEETLERAVNLALEVVPAAEAAGVSLISRGKIATTAATDDLGGRADALQVELRQGPLFDAIQRQVVVYLNDLAQETRWPQWSARVVKELGLRSMLSFQLFTSDTTLGSLNLYSHQAAAFDLDSLNNGYLYAAHVGVAISNVRQQESLKSAIASRTIIGQAEGILMERFGLDGTAAFNTLRRVSQDRNIKLRDVAFELVSTRRLEGLQAAQSYESKDAEQA
jgi:transcriptional regulator with GAF, ATPase, and Fis domain